MTESDSTKIPENNPNRELIPAYRDIGVDKRNIEIARNLKNMGLGTTQIVQATSLSLTEIERLN